MPRGRPRARPGWPARAQRRPQRFAAQRQHVLHAVRCSAGSWSSAVRRAVTSWGVRPSRSCSAAQRLDRRRVDRLVVVHEAALDADLPLVGQRHPLQRRQRAPVAQRPQAPGRLATRRRVAAQQRLERRRDGVMVGVDDPLRRQFVELPNRDAVDEQRVAPTVRPIVGPQAEARRRRVRQAQPRGRRVRRPPDAQLEEGGYSSAVLVVHRRLGPSRWRRASRPASYRDPRRGASRTRPQPTRASRRRRSGGPQRLFAAATGRLEAADQGEREAGGEAAQDEPRHEEPDEAPDAADLLDALGRWVGGVS